MPQAKANPICRTTPVLTFAADYRSSHCVKRTLFLLTTGLLFAACTFAAKPPNVVLIISDDQSWTDYGFMEHEAIETPNIDRLAKQSGLFKRGYVPTNMTYRSIRWPKVMSCQVRLPIDLVREWWRRVPLLHY